MSTSIVERFAQQLLMRLFFIFEPLAPRFISYFLKKQLRKWKDKGLIDDYKTKTRRIRKFHYKIDVDLVLTSEQTKNILNDAAIKIFKRIRRWVHG